MNVWYWHSISSFKRFLRIKSYLTSDGQMRRFIKVNLRFNETWSSTFTAIDWKIDPNYHLQSFLKNCYSLDNFLSRLIKILAFGLSMEAIRSSMDGSYNLLFRNLSSNTVNAEEINCAFEKFDTSNFLLSNFNAKYLLGVTKVEFSNLFILSTTSNLASVKRLKLFLVVKLNLN